MAKLAISPDKAVPEVVRLAATATVLWALLKMLNVATTEDVHDMELKMVETRNRVDLITVIYEAREGRSIFKTYLEEDPEP